MANLTYYKNQTLTFYNKIEPIFCFTPIQNFVFKILKWSKKEVFERSKKPEFISESQNLNKINLSHSNQIFKSNQKTIRFCISLLGQ